MLAPSTPKTTRQAMTVVEVAVVISTTLLIVFGIFEYGRFLMTRQVLENAARTGARYAVVNTYGKSTADVQGVTFNALGGQHTQLESFDQASNIAVYRADSNGDPNASDSDWKNAHFGELVAVRISGNYKPVLPTFLFMVTGSDRTIPVQVTAVMYSEAN
jgi:Flp pilus assembly protein TadG